MVARARERWRNELDPLRARLERAEKEERRSDTPVPPPTEDAPTRCPRCGKSVPSRLVHIPPPSPYNLDPDRPCKWRAVGVRDNSRSRPSGGNFRTA